MILCLQWLIIIAWKIAKGVQTVIILGGHRQIRAIKFIKPQVAVVISVCMSAHIDVPEIILAVQQMAPADALHVQRVDCHHLGQRQKRLVINLPVQRVRIQPGHIHIWEHAHGKIKIY